MPSATLCGQKCGRNLLAWLRGFCPVDLSELDFRPQLEKPADPGVNGPEFEPRVFDFPKLLLQRLERTRDVPRARHGCRTSPASAWPGLLKYFRAAGSRIKAPGGPRIPRTRAGPVPRARVPRLPAEGPRYPGPDHSLKRVGSMSQEQRPRRNRPTASDSQVIRPVLSIPPLPEMVLGFVRQFPHDLSRLLDALHAIHGLPGPQRHRVERPGRRLVGDERGACLYGNANIRSPRLYGLTDELSLEPLDRLDTGTQDAMGRVRPIRGERLGQDRVLRTRGDELLHVRRMGPRLLRSDEPCAHPDRGGTGREGRGHGPPGADPAGRDDRDLDGRQDLAQECQEADLSADVASRLGSLGHDQVAARPLRGYGLGRGTELPGDEAAPRVGDLHEFRVGLLVEELDHRGPGGRDLQDLQEVGVELASLAHPVDDEVRAERAGRRATQAVEDLCDVLRWRGPDPADHSEASGIRDRRRQGR